MKYSYKCLSYYSNVKVMLRTNYNYGLIGVQLSNQSIQ